jgi:putative membrane protein
MINWLIKLVLLGLATFVASKMRLIDGVYVDSPQTGILVALAMAFLNSVVKPILSFLAIPITFLTLGLFQLVINIAMVYLAAYFVDGFQVTSWLGALLFSFGLSITSWVLGLFLDKDKK